MDRVVESGPSSALDNFASMTPPTSMKFEGHGKQLRTSGWFLGSFFVRSPAALSVLALMMLIAAIMWPCRSCFLVSAAAFANLMTVFTFAFQAAVKRSTPRRD